MIDPALSAEAPTSDPESSMNLREMWFRDALSLAIACQVAFSKINL